MAELKVGTVAHWQKLSAILVIFRLMPERGSPFPDYKPGQYIALRRDSCRLTKKVAGADGQPHYVTDLNGNGKPRRGPVTHSYSIVSAPYETREQGYLEFYVVLEMDEFGEHGRLSGSMFTMNPPADDKITYVNRIVGDFTLDHRANGLTSVAFVGTGTGLAPFMSMIRQRHRDGSEGKTDAVQYTLLHANRTYEELAFHQELLAIEASRRFDFLYLPSVSRPTARDVEDAGLGRARANNLLRHIFDMPLKEEQELNEVLARGEDPSRARAALQKTTTPALPRHISRSELQQRLDPTRTVILTCGNPSLMEDIKHIADAHRIRFEKEDW
jgi:ferredoxin-NADP reductase